MLLFLLTILLSFTLLQCNASTLGIEAGIEALVQRQLPRHKHNFVFHLEPQTAIKAKTHSTLDTFTLFDADGKVNIQCTTISACSRGLYTYSPPPCLEPVIDQRYLTEIGKVDVSWTGSRFADLPRELPPVGKNMTRRAIVPWRYHFNTGTSKSWQSLTPVTFSYTTVWWGWNEWEQMLDWMALHGINLPLAWYLS
jgi:alpha-N-acetylglucosaminidase